MNKAETKLIKELRTHCCQILLVPPSQFIGIGGDDMEDMIVHGSIKSISGNVSELTVDGQEEEFDLDPDVVKTIDACQNTDAIALFSLVDTKIKEIKQAISVLDATHVRFHHKNGSIWVHVFDYRCFLYEHRIRKNHPFTVGTVNLYKKSDLDFTFTMNAKSFSCILEQDYSVRIGSNGYAELSSSDYKKTDFSYLIKDQGVVEPVITFFNDQLGKDICFVPVPNSIPVDPRTTR